MKLTAAQRRQARQELRNHSERPRPQRKFTFVWKEGDLVKCRSTDQMGIVIGVDEFAGLFTVLTSDRGPQWFHGKTLRKAD